MTTDRNAAIDYWLMQFNEALARRDVTAATAMFGASECFWRDLVAFTWNIVTLEGRPAIVGMLAARLADTLPFKAVRAGEARLDDDGTIEARLTIDTRLGSGEGFVSIFFLPFGYLEQRPLDR